MAAETNQSLEDVPLLERTSAWKSALVNDTIVDDMVASEVADGFISCVPCGLDGLKSKHEHVAVGKLGVVIADPPHWWWTAQFQM